ncbi:LysR family transcriptional regulator [Endozoicomonadaceae bacterium StTr2]
MNLQGIDLNLLLVFEAIYNDGSLTKAGEQLNLSQPAVSNALKRLREKVGDPLFVRTADGMVPTTYAEKIIPVVSGSLAALRDCLAATGSFDCSLSSDNFRLTVSDYIGSLLLPGLMRQLENVAPGITITTSHIDRDSAYEKLRTGRTELVVSTDLNGPGLYQQQLFEDHYVTLGGKHHFDKNCRMTLKKYCETPHILFSLEGKGAGNVDTALAKQSLRRKVALRVPHVSVIPAVLEQTGYLATLPSRVATQYLERFELKQFQPPLELDGYKVFQYWHTRQHHDPACSWLRSVIKSLEI